MAFVSNAGWITEDADPRYIQDDDLRYSVADSRRRSLIEPAVCGLLPGRDTGR